MADTLIDLRAATPGLYLAGVTENADPLVRTLIALRGTMRVRLRLCDTGSTSGSDYVVAMNSADPMVADRTAGPKGIIQYGNGQQNIPLEIEASLLKPDTFGGVNYPLLLALASGNNAALVQVEILSGWR